MKIKEFAHKHALVFFYTTAVLALILIITMICSLCDRDYRFKDKRDMMMRYNHDKGMYRDNQMMRQERSYDMERDVYPAEEESNISTTSIQ